METLISSSPIDSYWDYLQATCSEVKRDYFVRWCSDLNQTQWDEPKSSADLNQIAVLALIEAEQCGDMTLRAMNVEIALQALEQGVALQPNHPLCFAHLAIVRCMIGETQAAFEIAFVTMLETLNLSYAASESAPLGLVYLPPDLSGRGISRSERLQQVLQVEDGYAQALLLFTDVLCRSQLVFYNAGGLRFLQLATQLAPDSVDLNLKLGLASIKSQRWEGLLYLQRARRLAADYAPTLHALYLAYRDLQQPETAQFWHQSARRLARQNSDASDWYWSTIDQASPMTYLPFGNNLLAVEASLRSIVTIVLLGQGDWFEAEMEFWRNQLQPGMTVIDVGANVGVYTFSAAEQVGPAGRVLAVEPFSSCVRCLQETCRVNQIDWVTVYAGAASDRPGRAYLSLHSASELNEVVVDEAAAASLDNIEEVACFPLDALIEQEQLTQVDWLKIDAEGHEIQVLAGSDRLLRDFAPGIIYENIAGARGSNTAVAEYLQSKGYALFRYQPYLNSLIPVESIQDLQGSLNIIALPPSKLSEP
jgi:FkbM family methyltransferase